MTDYDKELNKLLDTIIRLNKEVNNDSINKSINQILSIIKDAKRRHGYYELALEIIQKLEVELKEKFPLELIYRKACIYREFKHFIYMESENNNETAKKFFNEFLNKCDYSIPELKVYADRTKLYLIKITMKNIDYSGFNENKEDYEKAEEYMTYLETGIDNKEINDEVILSEFGEINNNFYNYPEQKERFAFLDFSTRNKEYFSNFEKINDSYNNYDIVIEYSSKKVYIRGIFITLSKEKLDLLIKVCLGCKSEDLIIENENRNNAHQRFHRLKEAIEKNLQKELAKIHNIELKLKKRTTEDKKKNKTITLSEIDPRLEPYLIEKDIKFLDKDSGEYGLESSEHVALIIEKKDIAYFIKNVADWEDI